MKYLQPSFSTGANSDAYRTAWRRIFGAKTWEHSGSEVTTQGYLEEFVKPGTHADPNHCEDKECWCHRHD